jgi:hypothetical protein
MQISLDRHSRGLEGSTICNEGKSVARQERSCYTILRTGDNQWLALKHQSASQ